MAAPTFKSKISGKTIVVTLTMNGKSQDFPKDVWSEVEGVVYAPTLVSQDGLKAAKELVDNNIASMSPQDFAKWLTTSSLRVKL